MFKSHETVPLIKRDVNKLLKTGGTGWVIFTLELSMDTWLTVCRDDDLPQVPIGSYGHMTDSLQG